MSDLNSRQSADLPSFHAWIGGLNLSTRIRADVAVASYKAASLDATHSPRRVNTFCGAIAGMSRVTDPERPVGEPRGRLLREAGACQDFEMRYVAPTASSISVVPEVAPISGHRSVDLSGAAGGLGDYVSGAGSKPPHSYPQKRAIYPSSQVTAILLTVLTVLLTAV